MDLSSLLGGLGLGSLATLFLKEFFENRRAITKRAFEEKREAYVSYLDVASKSQTMREKEAIWARTAAIERIKLCGNNEVVRLLDIVSNLPPCSPRKLIDELVQAMRKDLFPQWRQ